MGLKCSTDVPKPPVGGQTSFPSSLVVCCVPTQSCLTNSQQPAAGGRTCPLPGEGAPFTNTLPLMQRAEDVLPMDAP